MSVETRPDRPVTVERFARVYVKGPHDLPEDSDSYYDPDQGYYFKLHLDGVSTDEATPMIRKAQEHFDVELVRRVVQDGLYKERVYVDSPEEVPEGFKVETGPKGGVYYETGIEQVGTREAEAGGESRNVAMIYWDDIELGDDIVFETPDGEDVFAEISYIEERADDADIVHVEHDGETYRARPGTYTADDTEEKAFGARIRMVKAGDWVRYQGPRGGDGWRNVKTGEVVYQDQPPGETGGPQIEDDEDFDPAEPPEDGYARGWTGPPDSPTDLGVGQDVEFFDDGGYQYGEIVEEESGTLTVQTDEGEERKMPWHDVTARAEGYGEEDFDVEFEQAEPEDFANSVGEFIEENPELGAMLTDHPPEELEDHELIMTDDGRAGAAVSPDGDIQNVFAFDDAPDRAGEAAFVEAIENGGVTLDCYDTILPSLYASHGFKETGRMEFNPEFAPEGWNEEKYGQPDVVFMAYDPEESSSVGHEISDNYYDGSEWEQAKEDSRGEANPGGDEGEARRGVRRGSGGADTGGRETAEFDIEGEDSEVLEDFASSGGFSVGDVHVDYEPRDYDEDSPWAVSPGTPIHANPGAYGNSAMDVDMSVEDFADLQEFLGVENHGWGDPDYDPTPEDWWSSVDEGRVDLYTEFLEGEAEPEDYVEGGLAIPFVVVDDEGKLTTVQEGRHRTLAAQQAGLDEIPVRIYHHTDKEGEAQIRTSEKAEGSVTSSTGGAHNAVYSPRDDEDDDEDFGMGGATTKAEGHTVGPAVNTDDAYYRLEGNEVYCEEAGEVYDINSDIESAEPLGECPGCGMDLGHLVKSRRLAKPEEVDERVDSILEDNPDMDEDEAWAIAHDQLEKEEDEGAWTYYVGPKGGEGWMNLQTGEIRYQKERPGPAPEGGDGYDDWAGEGWQGPPEDPSELKPGQKVEWYSEYSDEYEEGTVESPVIDEESGLLQVDGDGVVPDALTAVEDPQHRHSEFFEDSDISEAKYWGAIEDEIPEDAPDTLSQFEVGEEVYLDLPSEDEPIAVPIYGYAPEESEFPLDYDALAFHYDDIEEEVGVETMQNNWGEPGDASPTLAGGEDELSQLLVHPEDVDEGSDEPEEPLYDAHWWDEGANVTVTPDVTSDGYKGYRVVGGVYDGAWISEEDLEDLQPANEAAEEVGGEDDESPIDEEEAESAVAQPASEEDGGVHPAEEEHYDIETYDPGDVEEFRDMSDIGANHGNSVGAMEVAVLPDGSKAVHKDVSHHSVDEGDIKREMVGYEALKHLTDNVPGHAADLDEGWAVSEVAPGVDAKDATQTMKDRVETEDFIDMAAKQMIVGNTDLHQNNLRVDEEGNLYPFDLDRSGGDVLGDWTGNLDYENTADRILGELEKSASALDVDTGYGFRETVVERASEIAHELDGPTVHLIQEDAKAVDEDLGETIARNIKALAEEEVTAP